MKAKVKTIDIQAKEWFDKVHGNSYFSARVTVNFGTKTEKTIFIPWDYGYGDQYKYTAFQKLAEAGYIKKPEGMPIWKFVEENNVILRSHLIEGCKKREMIEWGQE